MWKSTSTIPWKNLQIQGHISCKLAQSEENMMRTFIDCICRHSIYFFLFMWCLCTISWKYNIQYNTFHLWFWVLSAFSPYCTDLSESILSGCALYLFVEGCNDIESNPFTLATIAVSLYAGVVTIVGVILLILLLKRQAGNNRSYYFFSLDFVYRTCNKRSSCLGYIYYLNT